MTWRRIVPQSPAAWRSEIRRKPHRTARNPSHAGRARSTIPGIYVDLGQPFILDSVRLSWETAYATDQIQISNDATNWTTAASVTDNTGGTNDLPVSEPGAMSRLRHTPRTEAIRYGRSRCEDPTPW